MVMRLQRPEKPRQRENTIALINIVFLMLIFFLIAGTLAPPLDPDIAMITTDDADPATPPDALIVHGDGHLSFRGSQTSVEAYVDGHASSSDEESAQIELVADRDLPAEKLVDIVAAFRQAGMNSVTVITERSQ